jgi:hypothetical protein
MSGCPFYGFRWPARSPTLRYVGGNECGLDIDKNGVCLMEIKSPSVDYFKCPLVERRSNMLRTSSKLIAFEDRSSKRQTLSQWEAQTSEEN